MSSSGEIALNRKFIEMIKLLNIYLNHFPKHEKYALAQEIRVSAYKLYDLITETHKRYYKKTTITEMDVTHEQLRMKIYLANELGYFEFKDARRKPDQVDAHHRFMAISRLVDEIGKMIGAWMRKIKEDEQKHRAAH